MWFEMIVVHFDCVIEGKNELTREEKQEFQNRCNLEKKNDWSNITYISCTKINLVN